MNSRNGRINWSAKAVILIIALLCSFPSQAQESEGKKRSTAKENFMKVWDFAVDSYYFIYNLFNECDSAYVTPGMYHMSLNPTYSHSYEHYNISSDEGEQRVSIAPANRNKLGLYIGWSWISVGYSFDLHKTRPQTDFNVSLYSARAGLDLFYRDSNEGFRISGLKGFYNNDNTPLRDYDTHFDGLSVTQIGLNVYYIFNKKFSLPAAYSQSAQQTRSAGSFILGAGYNYQKFLFDKSALDARIQEQLRPGLLDNIKYHDLSINLGYSYNWVFAKNFLANLTLTPSVGYKNPSLKMPDSKTLLSSINFDFITRASLTYNDGKYFAGASLVSHTFSYNKDALSAINGFGALKVFFGFNFWREK